MAKFADGGSSSLISNKDLLDCVLSHVGYSTETPEAKFAYHSPLISFSTNRGTAFKFSNRKRKELEECTLDLATHFLWRFNFPLEEALEVGRYRFIYQADPTSCFETIKEQIKRGMSVEASTGDSATLAKAIRDLGGMYHSNRDTSDHYAEVIDVYTFVRHADLSNRDERLVENTLKRSKRDQEWLVYPKDPMPDGLGYSARLQMNKYLNVDSCYRLKER